MLSATHPKPAPWFMVAASAAAVGVAFFPLLGFRTGLHVPVMAVVLAVCVGSQHRHLTASGWRRWAVVGDPWLVVAVASLAPLLPLGRDLVDASSWLIAAALVAAAAQTSAVARLGASAWNILAESAIPISALAIVLWSLPWHGEGSPARAAMLFAALTLFAVAFYIWMWIVSIDREIRNAGTGLLGLALVALVAACVLDFRSAAGSHRAWELQAWLGVLALGAAGAGAAHGDSNEIRSTAVATSKIPAASRALVILGSILVAPALSIVRSAFDRPIDVGFLTTASAILSMLACGHVYHLMRRWGALEHDVDHDSLTGLPNRRSFHTSLDHALTTAHAHRKSVAVMFLDLDRFKNINDSLGHAAGNEMLIETARRLRRTAPSEAVVARLAGDEFAVLLPDTGGPAVSKDEAGKLLASFGDPFIIGRRQVYVTPSIGISHYPRDGSDASLLLQRADEAMYRAKQRGRNAVELYSTDVTKGAVTRLDVESALHSAVKDNQVMLFYQPKIDIDAGYVHSVEALIRWRHPVLGVVGPDQFIPVAEETGLINELGLWALIEGCTQSKHWYDQGFSIPVAINLSPRQFETQDIPDIVAKVMRMTRLPADLLELELTESLALQDSDRVASVLRQLRDMGVRRAIDDFGVGYSGLSYLNRFPFDTIKIDRKFVQSIDNEGAPIIDAIIALGGSLRLEVIAEGVETKTQVDYLRAKGCHLMQGFYFSPPLNQQAFEEKFLKLGRRRAATSFATDPPRPHRMATSSVRSDGVPNEEVIDQLDHLVTHK